ncbi:MAG: cytochrome c [Sedimenticola sp.]
MHRVLFVLPILLASTAFASAQEELNSPRQVEIIHLLKHDCGSCHGMRLEGGLGPALKPDQLKNWSAEQLALTIRYGRPGTPMPPWGPFLTETEAVWLAQQLKQGIQP